MNNICICKYCKNKIDKNTAYSVAKGQYYCNEEHYLSFLDKKNNNTKHSFKSPKGTERREYTDFILNLYKEQGFDKSFPRWQILMAQTNSLLKNNPNWTFETIKYILWYMKEILGIILITKESNWSPLSLVDYYAQEAEQFYNECTAIQKSVENYNEENQIIIKSNKSKKLKYKPINMEDL